MATDAFALTPKQVVWLAIMQCTVQGLLIPLLATFLTSKQDRAIWFKIYVVWVNVLCLAQTVLHTIQGFDALDPMPPRASLVLLIPILTGVIAMSVQAFFIHRYWRIFNRVLSVIPFLLLSLVSLVSAILLGVYSSQWLKTNSVENNKISLAIWVFSSFLLDFCTTLTTMIHLYRVCRLTGDRGNIVSLVWQVIWASAAPPLILMVIIIVDGYIIKTGPHAATTISAGITAKFFVLSLMINLVGQGYIRGQFDQSHPASPGGPGVSTSMAGRISEPIFAPTGNTIELIARASPASTRAAELGQEGSLTETDNDPNKSRTTIVKADEPTINHVAHIIKLTPES